jgi:hypothetical protein
LGQNIATILMMRGFQDLFRYVGTSLVDGTFSDIYRPDNCAVPMASFSYVAILGTVAAPIHAGFTNETIRQRWIEGIQALANFPLLVIIAIFLEKIRGRVTLHKRATALRNAAGRRTIPSGYGP